MAADGAGGGAGPAGASTGSEEVNSKAEGTFNEFLKEVRCQCRVQDSRVQVDHAMD